MGSRVCGHVMFNLDPPKIGSPRNKFSGTHSKKFVPTRPIGQPHQRKPVTTKDISGVHSCIWYKIELHSLLTNPLC